jgi:hypothetical protein
MTIEEAFQSPSNHYQQGNLQQAAHICKEILEKLVSDMNRLRFLCEHLRGMMTKSPLCDAQRFTADLELCYRRMWEAWCGMASSP